MCERGKIFFCTYTPVNRCVLDFIVVERANLLERQKDTVCFLVVDDSSSSWAEAAAETTHIRFKGVFSNDR